MFGGNDFGMFSGSELVEEFVFVFELVKYVGGDEVRQDEGFCKEEGRRMKKGWIYI